MSEKLLTKENAPFIFGIVCTVAGLAFGASGISKLISNKTVETTPVETTSTEVYIEETQVLSSEQVEQVQAEVHSAAEAGQTVANLQNALVRADMVQIDNVFEQMNPYFTAQQGVWSDIPSATFTFNTTYDFNGGIVPVTWTGVDDLGHPVAYVFANYNANSNQFSDVVVYRTSYAWNLINTDEVDYTLFPGMVPTETEETDETDITEPTQFEYPYEIGEVNPDTGDVISGYSVQDEGDIRPIMHTTLSDGTAIYYMLDTESGMYFVCDINGQPVSNDYYEPETGELF